MAPMYPVVGLSSVLSICNLNPKKIKWLLEVSQGFM